MTRQPRRFGAFHHYKNPPEQEPLSRMFPVDDKTVESDKNVGSGDKSVEMGAKYCDSLRKISTETVEKSVEKPLYEVTSS